MPAIFPRSRRCKAMHDKKVMDFNPLDLLATAAALKSDGPSKSDKHIDSVSEKNEKNLKIRIGDKNYGSQNSESDTVMTEECNQSSNSDVEKMLDEHNYGNARQTLETSDEYLCMRTTDLENFDKDCEDVDENSEDLKGRTECSCQTDELESSSEDDENDETGKESINNKNDVKTNSTQAIVDTPVLHCDNLDNKDTKAQVKQLIEACSINRNEINSPCDLGVTEHADTSELNKTDQEGTGQSTLQLQTKELSQPSIKCEQTTVDKNSVQKCTPADIKSEESRTVDTGGDNLLDCGPLPHETCDIDHCNNKNTTDVVNCQQEQLSSSLSSQQIEDSSCKGDNCGLFCANNTPNECSIMRSLLTGQKGMLENRNSDLLENSGLCIGDRTCVNDLNTDDSVLDSKTDGEETCDSTADVAPNTVTDIVQHSTKNTDIFPNEKLNETVDEAIPSCGKHEINICDKNKDVKELDSVDNKCDGDNTTDTPETVVINQGHQFTGGHSGVSITDEHSYAGSITSQRPSIDECLDTDTEMSSQDENTTSSNLFTSQLSEDSGLCLSSPCDESSFSEFPNTTVHMHSEISEKLSSASSVTLQLHSPVLTASPTDELNQKFPSVKSPVVERPSYSVSSFECPVSPAVSSVTAVPFQETPKKNNLSPLSPILLYHTPTKSPSPCLPSASASPKIGSYKIGTFGSISNSNIDDTPSGGDLSKHSNISPPIKKKKVPTATLR